MFVVKSVAFGLVMWLIASMKGEAHVHNHQVTLSCGSTSNAERHRIQTGPPGKRGPVGPPGPKGPQGQAGSCVKSCKNIENRLAALEGQPSNIYENCPSILYNFPTTTHTAYVKYLPVFPRITKATLCAWVRDAKGARRTAHIASYATSRSSNDLLWAARNRNTIAVDTDGRRISLRLNFPSQTWTHVCTSIDATSNRIAAYQNGTFTEDKGFSFGPIPGGGSFMIGQEQDTIGGGFQTGDTFHGSISNLMIWPRVLSSSEIHNIAHNCICPRDYSVTLTPDKVEMVGNVDYVFAGKCRVV